MFNYSLDFTMSSLIAICTISCLYKFVQIDHDPTITSCLYVRESVTYRLAHLHLNRKSNDDTSALYTVQHSHENKMFTCDVFIKCFHENKLFSRNVLMRTFWSSNVDFVLIQVIVQTTRIKCLQMWEGLNIQYLKWTFKVSMTIHD